MPLRDYKGPEGEDIGRSGIGVQRSDLNITPRQVVHSHLSEELNRQAHKAFDRKARLFGRDSSDIAVRRATCFGPLSLLMRWRDNFKRS